MGNNLEYKLLYLPFINKLYLNVQNQVIFFLFTNLQIFEIWNKKNISIYPNWWLNIQNVDDIFALFQISVSTGRVDIHYSFLI